MTKACWRSPSAGARGLSSPAGVASAALLGALLTAGAAEAGALPHRAFYHLELVRSDPVIGLDEVDGGLLLDWQETCEGWITQQRLAFAAVTEEGGGFTFDVRFSSVEALDGTDLQFTVRTFHDDRLVEEYRGRADLEAPGGPGEARFTEPEGETIDLPAGTLFPSAHMQRLLEAAEAGERLVSDLLFDGSGLDALTQVTAAIGAPRAQEAGEDNDTMRSWPVRIAYHALDGPGDVPEFELELQLREDGVARELVFDYGDYALRAVLDELEPYEAPDC